MTEWTVIRLFYLDTFGKQWLRSERTHYQYQSADTTFPPSRRDNDEITLKIENIIFFTLQIIVTESTRADLDFDVT